MSTKDRTFTTRIDIDLDTREQLIGLLNTHLASTLDLYAQTKHAHWNVKGHDFFQLHELFDTLAAPLLDYVDMYGERITALGGTAHGSIRTASETSILPDLDTPDDAGSTYLAALSERFAMLASATREAIDLSASLNDQATADLFTEVVRGLDKHLYFLEAHLR
mgnify:CR=1 FL=1